MIPLLLTAAFAGSARFDLLESDSGWKDIGNRASSYGRIDVRSREIDGLTCFSGAVNAQVSVDTLVRITGHMVRSPEWSSASLPVSEELERSGSSFVLFQLFDVPNWTLAADRYWVLRGLVSRGGDGSGAYRYERVDPSGYPRVAQVLAGYSGAIEPPTNFGRWTFTPTGDATRVEYRGCSAFGGSIPSSIQTWLGLQQLPTMMEELIDAAASGRY